MDSATQTRFTDLIGILSARKRWKSNRAAALALDCDPSLFSKVMKGEREIPKDVLKKLNEEHGVNLDYVLHGKGEKFGHNMDNTATVQNGSFQISVQDYLESIKDQKRLAEEKAKVLENQVEYLRGKVDAALSRIEPSLTGISDNIIVSRATVRAAIDYQLMKDSKGDEKKREVLMEQINKLIHLQLTGGQLVRSSSV